MRWIISANVLLASWAFVSGFTATTAYAEDDAPASPPNVVLITVDDLNWDSLGSFGCTLPDISPNIDRLADQSTVFDQAHVAIAICQPARASIFTGRYPHTSGALGFDKINPGVPTFVETLHDAGYYTAAMSKLPHVIPSRQKKAFDAMYGQIETGHGRNVAQYYKLTQEVISNAKAKERPFFINVNANDPHRPFIGSRQELNDYINTRKWGAIYRKLSVPESFDSDAITVPGFLPDLPGIRKEIAEYYTSVRRADQVVGATLRAIEESGQTNNTLIIFLSDHGIAVPFAKMNCYMHSTRTPLIIRWPDRWKKDTRIPVRMASSIDLAPTILDVCGLPQLEGSDGMSLLPLIAQAQAGETQTAGRDFVFTSINSPNNRRKYPMRSIVEPRFGYIWNGWANDGDHEFRNEAMSGRTFATMKRAAKTDPAIAARVQLYLYRVPEELYDYAADPDALHNLVADPAYADELTRLQKVLLKKMRETHDPQLDAYQQHLGNEEDPSSQPPKK